MKSSREQFEEWWEINYHNGNPPRFGWAAWRDGDGYKIEDDESELDGMWEAWQASRAAIEIELPSREDPANFFCEVYDCDMVHESLANCGLKVKS